MFGIDPMVLAIVGLAAIAAAAVAYGVLYTRSKPRRRRQAA